MLSDLFSLCNVSFTTKYISKNTFLNIYPYIQWERKKNPTNLYGLSELWIRRWLRTPTYVELV